MCVGGETDSYRSSSFSPTNHTGRRDVRVVAIKSNIIATNHSVNSTAKNHMSASLTSDDGSDLSVPPPTEMMRAEKQTLPPSKKVAGRRMQRKCATQP